MNRTHEALLSPYYNEDTYMIDLAQFAADHNVDALAATYGTGGGEYDDVYLSGYHHNMWVAENAPDVLPEPAAGQSWLRSRFSGLVYSYFAVLLVMMVIAAVVR
jgi:hypothetical protein